MLWVQVVVTAQCWLFSADCSVDTSYLLLLTCYLLRLTWLFSAECWLLTAQLCSADCSVLIVRHWAISTAQSQQLNSQHGLKLIILHTAQCWLCSVLIVLSADFSVLLFSPKFCCVDCSLMTVVTVCRLQSLQLDMVTLYLERGWARLLHPAFQSLLYHFSPCQQ